MLPLPFFWVLIVIIVQLVGLGEPSVEALELILKRVHSCRLKRVLNIEIE